ncbi:MAG: ATP-binding protein, partial [Actinopolymorphaceae bacterium]
YEPNPLLGRADDIAAVTGLLRTSRVTSIVGPGGLGKTRLAYVVSREAEQRVVHVVPLAGVTTDSDVAAEVASALGAGDARRGHHSAPRDALLGIVEVIRAGPALLVLDNCEQVVRGVADLVHALVSMSRDLRVLTTSRTPLGLTSEAVYLLPELALPTTVELFSQRARAARPDADLPRDVVQELCRRLDGLPLAVELAAARVRVMSVAEVARRLEDRFGLLRGSARDAPERHHTLHAVVDWSWNLLGPDGQSAMRALSIFPGGFTAAAAQHLPAAGDALSVLEGLVDQSLLKVTDTASGTRFRMLETVREFSTAARESAGETDRATTDFLAWARGFGVAHHDSVFGPDPFAAVGRVRAEQDNLVQAFRLGLARDDGASVVATSAAIGALLAAEGNYARVDLMVGEADWLLSHYRPAPEFVEATRTVLTLASVITQMIRGQSVSRSLVALRRLPPASPRTLVGAIGTVLNAPSSSPADLQRLCESDEPLVAAAAAAVVSYYWEGQGDLDNALALARRMVDALENQDVPWLLALAHARATELSLQIEDGTDPRQHLLAALPVLEKFGATTDVAGIRWWMVLANIQNGALDEAEHWVEQADSGQGFDGQASDGQASDGQAIDGQAIDGQAFGDQSDTIYYDVAVRAELRVAQGEVADGLRLWRRVVDGLRSAREQSTVYRPVGFDPWALEAEAVAVVAHAQHGRLDLVESITADLPDRLTTMLSRPVDNPPPYLMEGPIWGALLLALAMVDLDRGERSGDKRVTRSGVRLVALAERFRFLRYFRPTMSSARVRKAALDADRAVYEDAVSSYAGLDRDDLRLAALAVLHDRDPSRTSARAGS